MKKTFLNKARPKGWGKSRNEKNAHAKGRRQGVARSYSFERDLFEDAPATTRRPKGDYLFANCVVLAAAVFGPKAQSWAEAMLPTARQLDARRAA